MEVTIFQTHEPATGKLLTGNPLRHALAGATLVMATFASSADAKELAGFINSFECATQGTICPADSLDPHITLAKDFVIQEPDGTYYLMPNVPRDVMVRYVLDRIRVSGEMKGEYNAIVVDEFASYNKADDSFSTVWSEALVEAERKREVERAIGRETGG